MSKTIGRPQTLAAVRTLDEIGEEVVADMLAKGLRTQDIAATLGIALRGYFTWQNMEVGRKARLGEARKMGRLVMAETLIEEGLEIVDQVEPDRERVLKARLQSGYRMRMAEKLAPEEFGGQKSQTPVNVNVNIGDLHLSAVREANAALPGPPAQEADYVIEEESEEDELRRLLG